MALLLDGQTRMQAGEFSPSWLRSEKGPRVRSWLEGHDSSKSITVFFSSAIGLLTNEVIILPNDVVQ